MGKSDRNSHKNGCHRAENVTEFVKHRDGSISGLECLKGLGLDNWAYKSCSVGVGKDGKLMGSLAENVKRGLITVNGSQEDSYEVWCICRVLKPCRSCSGGELDDREITPTPDNGRYSAAHSKSRSITPTPQGDQQQVNGVVNGHGTYTGLNGHDHLNGISNGYELNGIQNGHELNGDLNSEEELHFQKGNQGKGRRRLKSNVSESSGDYCDSCDCCSNCKIIRSGSNSVKEDDDNRLIEKEYFDLQELFTKLDELKENGHSEDTERGHPVKCNGHMTSVPDTPTSVLDTPMSAMDNASLSSFDHFDFDTSFCSLKSTDTMEQGDLADQLSLVQQMVMEMKTGFAKAMEELSKIQYGDQTLQQQLADNKRDCSQEIHTVKSSVDELRTEVQRLSSQVQDISDAQRSLQDKVDGYQTEKLILLEELERNGVISDQTRLRLSGSPAREANNNVPEVGPMVHPYLNSLQQHHRVPDDHYNSDSSLTAAVSRSLNLTQALGEKCLNLDFSTTSSDDEDNSRHSGSSHNKPIRRHRSFQFEESGRCGQKVAPHEHMLEEVHREESARDIVEAEREYCAQIWSLLEDYMNPVREEEIISNREYHSLFPIYIPQLYEQHCIILRKLEDRMKKWKYSGVIGDIFAKFTESLEGEGLGLYKDYINDFPTIISTMNKWFTHSPHFRELMQDDTQSSCLANSPILPLLLAPLQQVPKYSLLLKGLLKYTPADHPDRYYLESSLNRLKHFLNEMNDDLEHAMQVINSNNPPMNRTRDFGHSGHSKSSGSSAGEVNHLSRDSGIHSNEEERDKSPMSPNTKRRYLVQMLREKREHELYHGKTDGHPATTRGRKDLDYGSHPDLSKNHHGYPEGRTSPFLSSLPQSKTFSSLSKLPLPRDKGKMSRTSKGHEGHRPHFNSNYLRPLTPQVFPTSTSAHNFESARRRDEHGEKGRRRPASAVEFAGYNGQSDRHDLLYDMLAQQASLTVSPPHSSSSDKSRREMQLSLQKLLIETNNAPEYSDNDPEDNDYVNQAPPYHKKYLATKDKMIPQPSDSDYRHTQNDSPGIKQEDYGIYGDDDEEDDGNNDNTSKVKPMRLLPDTHRPKIMVPRWRQNASPQPPSYQHTVDNLSKPQNGSNSEENLAASLAKSLLETQTTGAPVARERHSIDGRANKDEVFNSNNSTGPLVTNSLKRRLKNSDAAKQPKVSAGEPRRSQSDKLTTSISGRTTTDKIPVRPTDLNIQHNNSGKGQQQNTETTEDSDGDRKSMRRPTSVTKLSDVIAYTADCIEKSETNSNASVSDSVSLTDTANRTSIEDGNRPAKDHSKLNLGEATKHMRISSVDADTDEPQPHTKTVDKQSKDFSISFSVSPSAVPVAKDPVNTDAIVNYFQNRNQLNQEEANVELPDKSNRVPTFISMNKTSTPISEPPFQIGVARPKDSLAGFAKKESGRLVRGDNMKDTKTVSNASDNSEDQTLDTKVESEGATKESILNAVNKLRLDLERQKQNSEERRQSKTAPGTLSPQEPSSPTSPTSPTSASIQRHFNDLSKYSKPNEPSAKPQLTLRTFSPITAQSGDKSSDASGGSDAETKTPTDSSEPRHGIYKKAGHLKTPNKYPVDTSASARQIQKLERSASPPVRTTSPTVRATSPINHSNEYDKFKSQVETASIARPMKRGSSPSRGIKGVFAATRSKSPTMASVTKERPKSVTALPIRKTEENGDSVPLKSAMKDTKIPVMRKAGSQGSQLSKSSEDISKLKKKSAFKDQLKNIFGRKKKRSKLYNGAMYDPDEAYNNHVTIDPDPGYSFRHVDDDGLFRLTPGRRANSTSQILQNYMFEDEDDDYDDDPISAV